MTSAAVFISAHLFSLKPAFAAVVASLGPKGVRVRVEEALSDAAASNLSGVWHGQYTYDEPGREAVGFIAELSDAAGVLAGWTEETAEVAGAPATLRAALQGKRSGGFVTLVKLYERVQSSAPAASTTTCITRATSRRTAARSRDAGTFEPRAAGSSCCARAGRAPRSRAERRNAPRSPSASSRGRRSPHPACSGAAPQLVQTRSPPLRTSEKSPHAGQTSS